MTRGRPRVGWLGVYLTVKPSEKPAWKRRAEAEGRTLRGWIRHVCNEAMKVPPESPE